MTGGDEHIMHGGVKFYRGSAAAARLYVEADRIDVYLDRCRLDRSVDPARGPEL